MAFTKEEANTLDRVGFYCYWLTIRNGMGLTREKAYEITEAVHQKVHRTGERKYNDFSSFNRDAYSIAKKSPAV